MICLSDVTKIFNQGKSNEFYGIKDLNLEIPFEKITCIQGPSGSGKTTLLSMIGCLFRPTQGRITLDGQILSGLPERFLSHIRQQRFGFVFQQFYLIRGLTVLENIMLPGYPLGTKYKRLKSRALNLLAQFELMDKKYARIQTLSGGEAQRTAMCRALVNDPDILIADEPTANLDTGLSEEMMHYFGLLKSSGKTIIISSHDPIIYENPIVDHHVGIRDGKLFSVAEHAD